MIELSSSYESQTGKSLKLDQLFVLSEIVRRGKGEIIRIGKFTKNTVVPVAYNLGQPQDLEFIEPTGKTPMSYILHITKRKSTDDKMTT